MTERDLSPAPSIPIGLVDGWHAFGVVAGMTERPDPLGGDFDLGLRGREPVGEVMARWDRFRAAFSGFQAFRSGHQVHGTTVLRHQGEGPPGWTITEGVDGHVTDAPGILLLVTVADCIPVFLFDPVARVAGLMHAGWRGTAGGIFGVGLEMMSRCGADVENTVMHCGVGICGGCYEVGSEVADALGLATAGDGGRVTVDLRARLVEEGSRAGIRKISVAPECSREREDRFFSHRRGGVGEGRMVAFLGMPRRRSPGGLAHPFDVTP